MRAKLTSRPNIAQIITDAIVLKLAQGVKPWRKTWTGAPISRPLRASGHAYSGINCIFLWAMADCNGYMSPHWMTYRHAAALGGQVRKGEKSSWAVFYKLLEASEPHPKVAPNAMNNKAGCVLATPRRIGRRPSVFCWCFAPDSLRFTKHDEILSSNQ